MIRTLTAKIEDITANVLSVPNEYDKLLPAMHTLPATLEKQGILEAMIGPSKKKDSSPLQLTKEKDTCHRQEDSRLPLNTPRSRICNMYITYYVMKS